MLRKRILTALWGIPLVILAVWFDGEVPWFTILAMVAGLLAIYEFYRITEVSKVRPLMVFGIVWTLLLIIELYCPVRQSSLLLITSATILSLVMLVFLHHIEGIFQYWAWMVAGVFYIGWLLRLLVELSYSVSRGDWRFWVFLVLFTTFASDTAAYFVGKAMGKHKMAPHISPSKTWEGAIAGLIAAVIISNFFTLDTPLQLPFGSGHAIILGVLISIFGQFGDLAESMLKRSASLKDSGSLMPGHGGLLDRIDSILFAGAVTYLYYIFIY